MSQRLFVSCSMLSVRRLLLFSQSSLMQWRSFSRLFFFSSFLLLLLCRSESWRKKNIISCHRFYLIPDLLWDRKNRWTSDFTVHSEGWKGWFLPWKQLSVKDYRWVWEEKEKECKIAFRSLWSTIKNLKGEAWKKLQVPRGTVHSVTDIMEREGIWIKYSLSYQILSCGRRLRRRWKKTWIRKRFTGIFMLHNMTLVSDDEDNVRYDDSAI